MKLTVTMLMIALSFGHVIGRIRNGYEPKLQSALSSLRSLNLLTGDRHASLAQRLRVQSEIENLVSYLCHYEITSVVLDQLKILSPGIYHEIDSLTDRRGRLTDVYVKVIPKEQSRIPLRAASLFKQAPEDEDAHISEHGLYSVCVEICLSDHALLLLSHELGHIRYIVPNLATYVRFYCNQYKRRKQDLSYVGHSRHDESGKVAGAFEKRFLTDRAAYVRRTDMKPESVLTHMRRIRQHGRSRHQTPDVGTTPLVTFHHVKRGGRNKPDE